MIVGSFIFIPFYWRSKVFTVPEYLGTRYNQFVRLVVALLWGFFMTFMLGIFLYTAAKMMHILVGWPIYISVLVVAVVVGIYTLVGGLSAVVYVDVVQCVILFLGSTFILGIAMYSVGGWWNLVEIVTSMGEQYRYHFQLAVPADAKNPYGWAGIFFGLTLVLSPAYWLGNQAIVQRALGAKSEYEAKKSMIWGAFLKLFIPFILVIPGITGVVLYPGLENGDDIYPVLIRELLPPGLTGLVFAAFLAALISSVDSYLNSAATLWTKDIYQKWIRSNQSERHYMIVGRIFTFCFIIMGVILAPLTELFPSIFGYMQTMLSLFQGPILALIVLGMLWKGATGKGGVAGLVLGVGVSGIMFWVRHGLFETPEPFLYIAWWSFIVSLIAVVIVSLMAKKELPAGTV